MAKIQTIKLQNFKSISEMEADFKGCSAIVTGGNNKGKTSFLRGIVDRIRFVRPDVMVKTGEKEGRGEMILDTGDKFVWEFSDAKDKLTLVTKEGRQSVTKELGAQFFPPVFDIDKFLQSPPKSQVKQLQQIVGLDFTDIDKRYEAAYNIRTERNREAELYRVKLEKLIKCDKVYPVSIDALLAKKEAEKNRLNSMYLQNRKHNKELREAWEKEKSEIDESVNAHNKQVTLSRVAFNDCSDALSTLAANGYLEGDAYEFVSLLADKIGQEMKATDLYPVEPKYIEEMPDRSQLDAIDAEILQANEVNAAAQKYAEYIRHVKETDDAKDAAYEADRIVKEIEAERKRMIESVQMPDGIDITPVGITVDGFPLDRNQISTSKLYTSALKIASINLGEVRTLYFDASFLDRNTLADIQSWANDNDLQLLIERPDFDGGEIQYQLIEQ